jgi:UDP-galactopyranose mutase
VSTANPPTKPAQGALRPDAIVLCLSHLRWDFVLQRPQHLMGRFAGEREVIYWEEPLPTTDEPWVDQRTCPRTGVVVATPMISDQVTGADREQTLERLLRDTVGERPVGVRWHYTPMMLPFSRSLASACVVYDCMDELANFRFAPPELPALERELMTAADVVFTGGYSLYEAKQATHADIHPFPSSVDCEHFARARESLGQPEDQARLAGPRLGFYGVIDERMDLGLLEAIADARPDWTLVLVGPVVKIDPEKLPQRPNIAYLGSKSYAQLPDYLAGWDVALMPFAINESTRFISPTKTPEYLAGGRPVVSTPITDVVRHYGHLDAVRIADDAESFITACAAALVDAQTPEAWLPQVDAALAALSWDVTFQGMRAKIETAVAARARISTAPSPAPLVRSATPASRNRPFDYVIVGAGFAGSVLAERLAAGLNKRVLLIDRRPHIGGNAYDEHNADGVLIHRYGPHIFHTNSQDVAAYLSRFTRWRPYEHRVLAQSSAGLVPIPINRTTLNTLYGLALDSDEAAANYLASRAERVHPVRTSEDVVVSAVGRDLYERFFQGYTRKQWGMDPSELDKSVTARVPTRVNTDDRYFTDSFQAMPAQGYTRMFEAMLDHPNITVQTGVDWEDVRGDVVYDHLIYTGPIDEYFDFKFGALPYRSLRFRHETVDRQWFQDVGTVNYPSEDVPYTRISEYKHMTGQVHAKTTVTYEYPAAEGDPYYPVPRPENQALFKRYEALAMATPNVSFVGRLATYRYYNMDQVVGQALATFRRLAEQAGRTLKGQEVGSTTAAAG